MERTGNLVWMAMSVLVGLLAVNVIAQPGFLSIDCGGDTHHTDKNNITWITDANYIDVGKTQDTGNATLASYLQRLRFFPNPLNKSCYQLPLVPNVPYLFRLWFAPGEYSGFQTSFAFSNEAVDMLFRTNVTINDQDPIYYERIIVTSGSVLYICLIRTSQSDDPFINAIELRTLLDGMYGTVKPGTMLHTAFRVDLGANSTVRYPQDNFDRIWIKSEINPNYSDLVRYVSSQETISESNTKSLPPAAVMQTAWVMNLESYGFTLGSSYGYWKSLLLLYFAEMETLNMSETRSFYVGINGKRRSDIITLVPKYSALELTIVSDKTNTFRFDLYKAINSTRGPILSAYEFYLIYDTGRATYSQDVETLDAVKRRLGIKDRISDPCYSISWEGIACDSSSSIVRISEINLSGRNFTGSVPEDIGNLTAIVNVLLDNNHLFGPLPNFSNLIMLERLHLQNNNLSGSVPEWLSELKNLKEVFIENNNFSGVIPAQLLNMPSLKLKYSGNHYLCMDKGQCIQQIQETRNNFETHKAVLGITISGAVLMALALTSGIAIYWKKLRTKQSLNEATSIADDSVIIIPNQVISRPYTLEAIIAATEEFSRKIGQGGFGSVFFGKLADGKAIAVKVLSSFSNQGVHEFNNEIDLLSRVHHKNLVSLLGYCNESRDQLMLIYDYMSRGSLRDGLYGPGVGLSKLNWRTRLKIALDAAQGLEYLHVGCTPKIIHRDVKAANILLDSNLNGKLADFGLSKMTIDEEATHVTTTVKGTVGYMDPEYFLTQTLTEKSDVYSFGVVLFEMICGRPPINVNLPEEEVNLIQWVTPFVKMDENPDQITVIIDKRLGGNYDMKSVTCIAKLAIRCVEAKPWSRPSATEVVAEIRVAIVNENADNAPISEGVSTKSEDLQASPRCSRVDNMAWADNSSNLPQVGR